MALAAPTNLQANPNAYYIKIQLSWINGAYYDEVIIGRRLTGGTWGNIATVSGTATAYLDTNLVDGTSYDYRVRGHIVPPDGQYSDYSNTCYNIPF